MRGIVINPYIRSITEAVVDADDIRSLQLALSWAGAPCTEIGVAGSFPNGDNLLITPVFKEEPTFSLGLHQHIGGMAIILGVQDGEWADAKFLLTDLQDRIMFHK